MIVAPAQALPADAPIACAQVDPDLFHVNSRGGATDRQVDAALWYCRRCPVRVACRDFALSQGSQYRRGLVAGGWYWPTIGRPRQFPGDRAGVAA